MDSEQPVNADNSKAKIITTIAVLLVIVLIVAGVAALKPKVKDEATTTPTNSSPSQTTTPTTQPAATSSYKDGEYSATGSYISPGGRERITVKVTLKNGAVTETSAESIASNSTAKGYQSDFIESYESQVVGKKIDDVSLSRVSGSSLTSRGFNEAIEQIKDRAKG